ncbi:unnamed protein product [Hymenolepis diminuta]|uniref:Gamma-tubulin complex component n=1 Tax=Hymenolepis diminuta TaxID=6216 RepID=A0A0R3SGR9_HYMDI|nr:unnamed protein product [Hymenolepis diminuta]
MVGSCVASPELNEYLEYSIPDNILFSENFEHLVKECKSISGAAKGSSSRNFIPFLKTIFDLQIEAHELLSWLKLATKAIRNRCWIATSVQSLLIESNQRLIFSHASYSPRTVLAKDYMQVLKHIDCLWNKVGFHLRSFAEHLNDLTVLSTLQNEISILSSLVTDVSGSKYLNVLV